MSKRIKQVLWLSVIIVLCTVLYWLFLRRTPESIIKTVFDINMSEFTYSVDSFEEQWYPNGDGYIRIVIKLKEITPTNVVYLKSKHVKSLPIPEKLKSIIPHHFLLMKVGYYLFFSLSEYDK